MTPRLYVSKTEASFFMKNKMGASDNIPTSGTYNVGDFIVSTKQENNMFGWVCVKAGTPGEWKEIFDLSDITKLIENNKINISKIETRVSEYEETIENVKKSSHTLSQKANEIDKAIKELRLNDMTIIDKVNAIEIQNGDVKVYIKETLDKIEALNIQHISKAISQLELSVNDNKLNISIVQENLQDISNRVSNTENALETLNKQVGENGAASKDAVDSLQKDIEELQELLGKNSDENNEATSGLQKEIQDIQKDVEDLKESLGKTAEDGAQQATGLQKEIQEIQKNIADINTILGNTAGSDEVDGAIKQINTNKTDISNLKNVVNNNTTSIVTNATNISTNTNNINTNKSDIANLKTKVEANTNEITNLKTKVNTNTNEISNLKTNVNTNISKLQNQITALESVGSNTDTSSSLDINSDNITSSGSLVDDGYASHGKCYSASSSSSNVVLYSSTLSDVKFGHYALCLRLMTNNKSSSNIVKLTVYNGSSAILTKNFTGTNFDSTTNYTLLYTTFEYTGIGSTKNNLKIQVEVLPVSGVTVKFDYAYISMIIPSVFL